MPALLAISVLAAVSEIPNLLKKVNLHDFHDIEVFCHRLCQDHDFINLNSEDFGDPLRATTSVFSKAIESLYTVMYLLTRRITIPNVD